jgi:hypothetical protein
MTDRFNDPFEAYKRLASADADCYSTLKFLFENHGIKIHVAISEKRGPEEADRIIKRIESVLEWRSECHDKFIEAQKVPQC